MKNRSIEALINDLRRSGKYMCVVFTLTIISASFFSEINNDYIYQILKLLLLISFIMVFIPFLISLFTNKKSVE